MIKCAECQCAPMNCINDRVDLIFYRHTLLLSIPLALLTGAFTVVAPEAYKKNKDKKSEV
jgi:hypothetical protein